MRKIALLKRLNSTVRTGLLAGAMVAAGPVPGQDAPEVARLTARAEAGDLVAMTALGDAQANGSGGLQQNHAEALKWYRRAADRSHAAAQFSLGLAYELGRGVAPDAKQAFTFYLAAAEQGFAPAQFNVGNMYASGRGVGQDFFEANLWFKQAADSGVVEAQFNLGVAYEAGNGFKQDDVQAARWYRQAAERGYMRAQYNYALLLEDGRGVARDLAAAASFYRAAAEQGFAPAQVNYGLLLSEGRPGVAADPVQAYVWLSRAVQGGANAEAREALARRLTQEQLAAATRQLGEAPAAGTATASRQAANPAPESGTAAGSLVEQLREQSRRLAARVETLTTEKETAERQSSMLTVQIRDLQQELQQLRASGSTQPDAAAAEVSRLQGEVAAFKTRLEQSTGAIREAEQANAKLAEANQRLQQEKAAGPSAAPVGADSAPPSAIVANLQRDNARLNDEVKRATRELLSLNSQVRTLRSKSEATPAAGGDVLQQQVRTLQSEKADLEQWSQSLEKTLNEKTAAVALLEGTVADLRLRQAGLEQQRAERPQPVEPQTAPSQAPEQGQAEVAKLKAQVGELSETVAGLQAQLAAARSDSVNAASLRDSLVQANTRIADLQRELTAAQQQGEASGAGSADLRRQLREANAALEKSGASVAELTAANDRLEQDFAAAKQSAGEAGALRDELAKLRQGAAETVRLREDNDRLQQQLVSADALRGKNEQLALDHERLTAALDTSRRERTLSTERLAGVEKQLADALTIRTRSGDESGRVRAELAEANRTVEKLNATVGELTAENQKLEQDLDNAQKAAAAALAAQSQAVSAANPDAFRMEISTLQARVKEIEAQAEEERTGAAREISTLAGQLQRSREANRSLTEANRALVAAKESDTASVRDEFAQGQTRIRELTAAAEESRRQVQQQAAELRALTEERESLRAQLTDAQKVATVLPGMADDNAALQERLETVGAQLVQLQREHEALQKSRADLEQQAALSRQAAQKAEAELAALHARLTEADRADETHTATVAELTQANARLEQEREDMRRLVESYRADIARLTQVASTAEQLKADAERSGQQNVDAATAQLAQLRRELEAARANQARLTEAHAAQERERGATIGRLRTENAALAARLNQAQGTLDQIAAAARLGTPASTIAAGGPPPVVRTAPSPSAELRFHTVAEGDSLSRISLRYYGTPNRWQDIFQANRDVLQGSSALRIGMQLRIP